MNIMNLKIERLNEEKGITLLEVVISIAVLGILLCGFIPALMGATKNNISVDDKETAMNLATSQMEYIKNQTYASSYTLVDYDASNPFPGYIIKDQNTNTAGTQMVPSSINNRDANIQSITIEVYKNGVKVGELTGYKMK